jgi:type IV pilus assembly protein PilQ
MFRTMHIKLTTTLAFIGLLLASLAQANSLQAVAVSQGEGGSQVVKITFKDGVAGLPMHFTTANPHRIVLDFADASSALGRASESLETGLVRAYNVLQAGGRTRVVLNLAGPATYDLRKDKNVLMLAVRSEAAAPAAARVNGDASKAALAHSVQNIDFKRSKDGDGRIEITLSDPGVGVDVRQKGQTVQVDIPNTSLPKNLQRRLDVSDFATPAQTIEATQQDRSTRLVVTPKGKWDYFAYQTGQTFVVEIKSLETLAAQKAAQPRYTGEKLSLSFHDEDVNALLKVIADFTGLNIIASETVKGNVTLRLVDVPWDQALDIILRAKGLDKRVTGNVIWVAPRDELAAKEKLELESKQQLADLVELQTETIKLNYLRADEANAIVLGGNTQAKRAKQVTCTAQAEGVGGNQQQAAQATTAAANSMLSKRGYSTYDLKTNALFVNDTPDRIEKIRKALAAIDTPVRQLMIEARIVLADDGWGRELGAKLGFAAKIGDNVSTGGSISKSESVGTGSPITSTLPYNVNLPGGFLTNKPAFALTLLEGAGNAILSMELQALEEDRRGKIVSNPRVVTQNQTPAVILQGQQIPYSTSDPNAPNAASTTEFVDAFLCLLVDPQILNNDEIILDVEVQKDAAGAAALGSAPPIDTRRVKTQVRVKNGETAILGGIFEQETRDEVEKVPLLGDIPGLGWLFKTTAKLDRKTELMIFLTPRLVDDRLSLQ